MAFPLSDALGFGDSSTNYAPTDAATVINKYARVTAITSKTITIADPTEAFEAGDEILFQVFNVDSTSYRDYVGAWRICKIKSIDGSVLTVNNKPTKAFPADYFSHASAQISSLPHYKNFTLNSGISLKPTPFASGRGGVVALKCSGTFKLKGGHIDLTNAGLTANRTLTQYELDPSFNQLSIYTYDNALQAGFNNGDLVNHFTLNRGDGACFIIAKEFVFNSSSRIGNPNTSGVAYCRGAHYSQGRPSDVDMRGGSNILIAAESVTSFETKCLAKYRSGNNSVSPSAAESSYGLASCCIATETDLPLDEALYSHEVLSDPARLHRTFNISGFGDGSDGSKTNPTSLLNNYARITDINDARNILTYTGKTTAGLAKFKVGALVMIHPSVGEAGYVQFAGRFHVATIVGLTSSKITLDKPLPSVSGYTFARYDWQVITIPQFSSFTLSNEYAATLKYSNGKGGICAIAVSGTCTINGGLINVTGKGGAKPYGAKGLKHISNAGMATRLPIGAGHGSVFILAKNLVISGNARLGATYPGYYYGGYSFQKSDFGNPTTLPVTLGSGWQGLDGSNWGDNSNLCGGGGSPQAAGKNPAGNHNGGLGSNASDGDGLQGAHVMIVADSVTGLEVGHLSTGGQSATTRTKTSKPIFTAHGGASYGGGGVYSSNSNYFGGEGGFVGGGAGAGDDDTFGTGGGSGGFAFVYANSLR